MEDNRSREQLQSIAKERLFPSITNPNYLVLRRRAQLFREWSSQLPEEGLKVLDLGGRYQPYRPLFQSRVAQYVALDILQSKLVDVVGRGEQLPFANEAFDLVIATQVFEYFPEPSAVAKQIHAILKPGGLLLMSVCAVSPRFVDDEHWRYMPAGLRSTLCSFSDVEIVPETFTLGGFCRMVNAALNILVKYDFLRKFFSLAVFPIVNLGGLCLESLALTTNDQMAGNYSVAAKK